MKLSRVAKRYAHALLKLAEEQSALEEVRHNIRDIAEMLENTPEFSAFVKNPLVNDSKRLEILDQLFKQKTHPLTHRALVFFVKKSRLNQLDEICRQFERLFTEKMGILHVSLTFACSPTPDQCERIEKKLHEKYQRDIQTRLQTDKQLIGGFRIDVENQIFDYSLAAQLEKFKLKILTA